MPPALDTPEEVAAMFAALFGLFTVIGGGLLTMCAALYAVWRSKIKPLLTTTADAAEVAAHQLQNNSGSSVRDAIDRIENTVDRLDRTVNTRIGALHSDIARMDDANDRAHGEMFRRIHALESPNPSERITPWPSAAPPAPPASTRPLHSASASTVSPSP